MKLLFLRSFHRGKRRRGRSGDGLAGARMQREFIYSVIVVPKEKVEG